MQADKGNLARIVDSFAAYWTPIALLGAVLLFIIPGLIIQSDIMPWLRKSLIILVLACPCALVVSSTVPSICCIAAAAKNGVLIKGKLRFGKLI